jgi:hypothetical protein
VGVNAVTALAALITAIKAFSQAGKPSKNA